MPKLELKHMPTPKPKVTVTAPKNADMEIEDADIGEAVSRTVFLMGDVTETLVRGVIRDLLRLSELDSHKPIYLVVSTYGGSLDEAFALYDAMRLCAAPVRTIGLGKIMSAGCLILSAGEKGNRIIGKHARLMYHAGYDVNGGDLLSQEVNLAEFRRMEKQYDQAVARETGHTLKQVQALYWKNRVDRYMTAQESCAFGFADLLV